MAATTSTSVLRVESENPLLNRLGVLLGILLLAAIGYGAKILEHSANAYAKAHHWTFPNIEYVLWAIVIGLLIRGLGKLRKAPSAQAHRTFSTMKRSDSSRS
ncbi:MAG TPA: hypothetical protein VN875_04195 [Candidatus Binatus sp.]|jgi:hypothetical protein|nr:hypothetical protein [Candidatus Binatus sp.]